MDNNSLTDAELLELEILLKEKYRDHKFGKIYHNETTNEITATQEDLDSLLLVNYKNRFRLEKGEVILSIHLFNLLMIRYFISNETVLIHKKTT